MMAIIFATKPVFNGSSYTFTFDKELISATAFVQGYEIGYESDNHVRELTVKCEITGTSGKSVTVKAICEGYDDSSNKARGTINITCVAEM